MSYVIEIMVPRNILSLCCSWHNEQKATTDDDYDLRELDPERLKEIIKAVKTAKPNQIKIRLKDSRVPNRVFMDDLIMWNGMSWHTPVDPEDLVKQISYDTYDKSFVGTYGPDKGKELHAFENVTYPGEFPGEKYYVKLVTPEEGKPIDVVSLHRTEDKFYDAENSQRATNLGVYELDRNTKRRFREWKKKQK